MSRKRVEDLGKISILIDEVLCSKFFEEEIFLVEGDKEFQNNEFLKILIEEIQQIRDRLYTIKNVADGEDYSGYDYD